MKLDTITVNGFKSIKELIGFKLNPLNILIGANGSGKSNFIKVFELLNHIIKKELQTFVAEEGYADSILYFGQKATKQLLIELHFGNNSYKITLAPSPDGGLFFKDETCSFHTEGYRKPRDISLGSGHQETKMIEFSKSTSKMTIPDYVFNYLNRCIVYHFHDTSPSASVRKPCNLNDNRVFRHDGENLSAFLYLLKHKNPISYSQVVNAIKLVAPFIKDFILEPDQKNPELIRLEWSHEGSDSYFDAHALSDGTLRFICLATLFLQPNPPKTILLDEPELGLHPYAITQLSEIIKSVSLRSQIIISTQSVTFINQFDINDIVVVERDDEQSVFKRLERPDMESWLDEYGLGDLWEKNVLGGRP